MDDVYLDEEMEDWERASDNDCEMLLDAPRIPRLPHARQFLVPWTFRRVYSIWGLRTAIRFLLKGVE